MKDKRCLNLRAVGGVVPLPYVRCLQRNTIADTVPSSLWPSVRDAPKGFAKAH